MAKKQDWGTIGTIASILGFLASILMIFFTDFKVAALISLLVAETAIVGVVWFYAKRRASLSHPFEREDVLDHVCYRFESLTKISYEVTEIFRVTQSHLDNVPIELTWSGRGKVHVESCLHKGEIQPNVDGQTGKIRFSLPLTEPKRFGDTAMTHYRLDLEDEGHQNVPQLSKNVKRPCQMVIFEVQLNFLQNCGDAKLTWRERDDSDLGQPHFIKNIPFDKASKTFRVAITDVCVGRKYQLRWEPSESA